MSPARGPVVPRRRLGAELRTLREQAGLTIEDVATGLECSLSKVSRLETGQGIPYRRDVRDLLDRYGITDQAHRERLMRWARLVE
jgi:transcriptional regulator with XRE-family HTH domain